MFSQLMTARRFAPLFWCQFLSAFNDNFVRQMLAMMILFRLGGGDPGAKIALGVAIFILPSIPLSPIAGEFADAHDKAWVARQVKLIEIGVQLVAAAGFVFNSIELLYVALFGLGCVSAMFGPVKYGILPDHLRTEELVAGNALVEGATFAAIIVGMVLGGFAAAEGRSAVSVVLQLIVVAVACYVTSRYIPPTGVGAPQLKVNYNPITATLETIKGLKRDDRIWVGAIAVSWFWMLGGITLSLVPVFIKSRIGGGIEVETAVNLFFAIGIGLGSLSAAGLAHGRIEFVADAVHADPHGPHRDPPRAFRRRVAACDDRDRARRVLRLGGGLADRAGDHRLLFRRGHVRGAHLRRGAGLVGRRRARAGDRRGQYAQRDLHGRRLAC